MFGVCAWLGVATVAGLVYWGKTRTIEADGSQINASVQVSGLPDGTDLTLPDRLYFRHNGLGANFGKLAWADLSNPDAAVNYVAELSCESVYVSAGRGICLAADRGVVTTYVARLFDVDGFNVHATIPLAGVPSRTRVSPNGRFGAATVFVTGHGYDSVDFSTQTLLLDMDKGEVIADLETFSVYQRGTRIQSADFNFWGVSFTPDSSAFYATLSTSGRHYLVRGAIDSQVVEVVREGVECPSLSPDGSRVAFKHRIEEAGRIFWELRVFELETGEEVSLSERRSVDDQLEWAGTEFVLYSVPSAGTGTAGTDIWIARADGTGLPALLVQNAYSPAAIRG